MEALGYVLIYFLKGGLPWQSLQVARNERRVMIGNMKKKVSTDSLCENLPRMEPLHDIVVTPPDEFIAYLDHTKKLQYAETPDYEFLKNLFRQCLRRNQYRFDYKFDWTTEVCPTLAFISHISEEKSPAKRGEALPQPLEALPSDNKKVRRENAINVNTTNTSNTKTEQRTSLNRNKRNHHEIIILSDTDEDGPDQKRRAEEGKVTCTKRRKLEVGREQAGDREKAYQEEEEDMDVVVVLKKADGNSGRELSIGSRVGSLRTNRGSPREKR